MRIAVTLAVLLAVVSTALVAVCQHSETRRLQHRVWQLERRRMRLERQIQRLEGTIAATRTPRRLLVEHDRSLLRDDPRPLAAPAAPSNRTPAAAPVRVPAGFVLGGNFEEGER